MVRKGSKRASGGVGPGVRHSACFQGAPRSRGSRAAGHPEPAGSSRIANLDSPPDISPGRATKSRVRAHGRRSSSPPTCRRNEKHGPGATDSACHVRSLRTNEALWSRFKWRLAAWLPPPSSSLPNRNRNLCRARAGVKGGGNDIPAFCTEHRRHRLAGCSLRAVARVVSTDFFSSATPRTGAPSFSPKYIPPTCAPASS